MKNAVLIFVIFLGCASCKEEPKTSTNPDTSNYIYKLPEDINDGWEIGSANEAGFDTTHLVDMINSILDDTYENVHSVVLIKNGSLVLDEYFAGTTVFNQFINFNSRTEHSSHSVTKSVNSILVGIALRKGLIPDLNSSLVEFFPEFYDDSGTQGRENITISHALAMTAGLDWNEQLVPYGVGNTHYHMDQASDPVEYVLTRPVATTPGSKFVYNSGLSISLGRLVAKVAGMSLGTFARVELFDKLQCQGYSWFQYQDGTFHTGGGLRMRPRDLAKMGQLYLNKGNWKGEQLVDTAYVENSIIKQAPDRSYGYQWWLTSHATNTKAYSAFTAIGRGGQFIFVIEELDLVAVFTQGNDTNPGYSQPYELLERFILRAL